MSPAGLILFEGFYALANWSPKVGDIVENFGHIGRVLEIDAERGVLLRAMPGQGFKVDRDTWYANPAKLSPVC